MPLIPELPEGSAALTPDPEADSAAVDCDTLKGSKERADDTQLLLESQAKIAGQRKIPVTFSEIRA